jgi:hypothetical protein
VGRLLTTWTGIWYRELVDVEEQVKRASGELVEKRLGSFFELVLAAVSVMAMPWHLFESPPELLHGIGSPRISRQPVQDVQLSSGGSRPGMAMHQPIVPDQEQLAVWVDRVQLSRNVALPKQLTATAGIMRGGYSATDERGT